MVKRYNQTALRELMKEGVTDAMVVIDAGGTVGEMRIMTTVKEVADTLDSWSEKDEVEASFSGNILVIGAA